MDDKIKAYVKNNIRKTAQTYLRIAKQPIEQAKFIGAVGREVSKAPAFLGKTAATGLIKIPTQSVTNGRVDLAKNKYIGKAFMTDREINQVSSSPTAPLKFLGQNVIAGAKTAATLYGLPAMATRQGLTSLGASSLLGGGLNKVMGQDPRQGMVQGAALAPTIAGITRYSNPMIERGVSKFAPTIANKVPVIAQKYVSEGIARVPGNVLEGGVIDATLGRRPLSLGSAAIDAATAFIPGNPNLRRQDVQLSSIKGVSPTAYKLPEHVQDRLYQVIEPVYMREHPVEAKRYLQDFLEAHAPGYKNVTTDKAIKLAQAILDRNAGLRKEFQTPYPKMGIVEDAKVGKNDVAQAGGETVGNLLDTNVSNSVLKMGDKEIPLTKTARDVSYPGKTRILQEIESKTPEGKFLGIRYLQDGENLNIIGFASEAKGKGYGTQLLNKVIADAKAKGIKTIMADDIRATNSSAYWEKQGFKVIPGENKAVLDVSNVAQPPLYDTALPGNNVAYHFTDTNSANLINKEGFKSGSQLGVREKRAGIFAFPEQTNPRFTRPYDSGGKVKLDLSNLKIENRLAKDYTTEQLARHENTIIPAGTDGVITKYGNGANEIVLTPEAANKARSQPPVTDMMGKIKSTLKDQRGFIRIGAELGGEAKPKVLAKSSSDPIIPPKVKVKDSKYAFNINKNRLNMNKGQTKAFEKQVKQALPELEKVKGKKLTFDEVAEEAQKADLFKKAVGREATANFEAQLTATRNRMVELNTQIDKLQKGGDIKSAERLTLELIQHIKSVSGAAADTGRRLGSFRITAEARPFREQLLGEIIKNQKYSDDQAEMLVKAAAGVDFNDPAQVSKFFKEVIKPSIGKMLEEYRYINLLSSPRTHITNIFSNAIQTGVLNPATKLTTGIVDPIASALTGKARENYIGEVPMYYRGMLGSFPDAFTSLKEVFQGKRALTNLDFKTLQRMPSKGNVITKSLEGFDVFFRTLIEGGEKQALDYKFGKMGKEAGEGVINNIAEQRGQYYTFRQGFDNPGQGAALDWFDKGTQAVMQLRRVPGVSWFVPFIQTPMNIVKQGFEYSPAGFSTMVKADNKTEQFSKALLGSAVFAGAGYMALNDRLTYAAPRDPEQKKLFYASGKQPYSVKVGDKWVSFSKIGPLAYPLALAGAIKYSFEDNPSAVTDDTFEKTTKALTGAVGFFADQSYMQGIGNMIKGLEGQEGYTISKIAGNVATQYVPLASLQRWVNNIIDPIYRKPKGLVENIKSSLIGQTGDMGYYEDPLGDPSKRQFPLQNAFSPVGITQENPQWNPLLDMRQQELQGNAILNQQEKDLQEKVGLNPASADSGDTKMDAYTAKMQEKMARNRVELLGEPERIGDKIIYQTDSGTSTLDLGKVTSLSEDNKYLKAIKNSKAFALADDIIESNLSDEVKNQALSDIGINRDDAEYYSIASQSNDLKSIYLLEVAQAFVDKSGNRQDMIDVLVSQRRKVNGDMIASDGVLDNLYNDGYITKEERKALKDIDFDSEGKLKVKPSSGGKKLKAIKAPTYKLSKKARQKLRKPKLASIKLEGSKKLKTTKSKKFAPIKLVNSKK